MPFGVKNGPPTYQRAATKAFCEYIDIFMNIFLDDFIVFSDMSTHLEKLKKCFLKCREFNISLNPNKCVFMVCLGTILGFIMSKKCKIMDPKKVEALVNMPLPTTPQEIQVFNRMAQFYMCFIKKFASIISPIIKLLKKSEIFVWIEKCKNTWEDIKN
jgi:hypothetical protein